MPSARAILESVDTAAQERNCDRIERELLAEARRISLAKWGLISVGECPSSSSPATVPATHPVAAFDQE